jgi:hypothetical protein
VNIPLKGQNSPLGAKFTPRGKLHACGQTHVVKNWPQTAGPRVVELIHMYTMHQKCRASILLGGLNHLLKIVGNFRVVLAHPVLATHQSAEFHFVEWQIANPQLIGLTKPSSYPILCRYVESLACHYRVMHSLTDEHQSG